MKLNKTHRILGEACPSPSHVSAQGSLLGRFRAGFVRGEDLSDIRYVVRVERGAGQELDVGEGAVEEVSPCRCASRC